MPAFATERLALAGRSEQRAQARKAVGAHDSQRDELGERFFDLGCGWGALLCHAAEKYGVHAFGTTLSQAQFDYVTAKIARLGLQDRVRIELRDCRTVDEPGAFDKIAVAGPYEVQVITGGAPGVSAKGGRMLWCKSSSRPKSGCRIGGTSWLHSW